MLDYDELFELPLFGLDKDAKQRVHAKWLHELTAWHKDRCPSYRRLIDTFGEGYALPVRLFKDLDLRSIDSQSVTKTMTSSGTTSQVKSKIYLDKDTSTRQTKALSRIVAEFTGSKKRLPMLVIDAEGTVKNRSMFSARTAGIRGFSIFGRDVTYALHDDMTLNLEAVRAFAERHEGESALLFGFTFMVWKHFIQALEQLDEESRPKLHGMLVHGGGWKKLVNEAVSPEEFARRMEAACGVSRACDYYGMVEQTGSISMECECGHLHASLLSDVEMVDPITMKALPNGERGLIKSISLLPTSYPGHILLTEDEGVVLGEDDCPCGRKGKYFKIFGRLPGAEVRGCSDTYELR